MAILNEWAVMGPNYLMLILGIFIILGGLSLGYAAIYNSSGCLTMFVGVVLALIMIILGFGGVHYHNEPNFQIPTGKKYIEATFANGSPTAAILEKYDVIDTDGKVYTLREKDGVKDEKRPKVTIYKEEVE